MFLTNEITAAHVEADQLAAANREAADSARLHAGEVAALRGVPVQTHELEEDWARTIEALELARGGLSDPPDPLALRSRSLGEVGPDRPALFLALSAEQVALLRDIATELQRLATQLDGLTKAVLMEVPKDDGNDPDTG